jgi:hypothetical protein
VSTRATRLGGPLREHLAAAVAQLGSSTPYSVDLVVQDVRATPGKERLFQDYHGDLSGRFLDAVAVAHAQGVPVDTVKTAEILREVLASQRPDGLFGPPTPNARVDHGSAWGHGRLLEGLLAAREWAPPELDRPVAQAAGRLVDGITARAPRWAAWVEAHLGEKFRLDPLSAVRPLTRYAQETGAASALETAHVLASVLPREVDGVHMHGYLLALRGQLELGRVTGDDGLVDDVVGRAEAVAERHLLPHGGVLESLASPWDVNTEGCGIADWIMLNLRLYDLRDDRRHLDRAGTAAFNALLHAQRQSGHFGCETLSDAGGVLVSDYAPEAWWCCTFHGIRALHTLAERAIAVTDDAVRVVLPIATSTTGATGRSLLEVETDYPYGNLVTLVAGPDFPKSGRLRLLIPSTATLSEVVVDGECVQADAADGWMSLEGLEPGCQVDVRLRQHDWFSVEGETRFPPFENTTATVPNLSAGRCAAFRGPLLLAAHDGDNPIEDLLRARYLVHQPRQPELPRGADGDTSVAVSGHDTFGGSLVVAPLARPDRGCHDRPVRAWYAGLLYAPQALH